MGVAGEGKREGVVEGLHVVRKDCLILNLFSLSVPSLLSRILVTR